MMPCSSQVLDHQLIFHIMYGLRQFHHQHNKEEEERRELAKKQQLLNKHRRGELHWTVVGEDRSGEEVKQSSCCHMVERPLQIHQAAAAYQKI
jgi:hypothetical protein